MKPLWLAIRLTGTPPSSSLACWAGGFTPRLSLTENALLLEIGGCLRLFHGLDALRAQVAQGLAEQGIAARIAVAATPQAAIWLAEGGGDSLDALPLAALSWPAGVAGRLARFGLSRLGELRRLSSPQGAGRHDQPEGRRTSRSGGPERSEGWGEAPQVAASSNARDGATPHSFQALARRIGLKAATMIARAYGEVPDPRPEFVFPPRFDERLDLPAATANAAALLFPARRLVAALAGWLEVRQAGLRACRLDLVHRQGATPVVLRFASATREAGRMERILRERLERLRLAAPVERLRLVAEAIEPLGGITRELFGEDGAREAMMTLVERLRARLGEAGVFGIAPVAEHRPECATRIVFPGSTGPLPPGPRPFWLLAEPEALPEVGGRPHRRGPLTLLAGPERIESGWWDRGTGVGDIRRDYFVALTPDGRWAWVFRELRLPGGWYLHGWFG